MNFKIQNCASTTLELDSKTTTVSYQLPTLEKSSYIGTFIAKISDIEEHFFKKSKFYLPAVLPTQ